MKAFEAQSVVDQIKTELTESVSQREMSPLLASGVLNTLSTILSSMVEKEPEEGKDGESNAATD